MTWEVRLLPRGGAPVTLHRAQPRRLGSALDAIASPGQASFVLGQVDVQATLVPQELPTREVQFWHDGVLVWWGVLTGCRASRGEMTVSADTLEWYYHGQLVGPVERNHIVNPDFTSGLGGWASVSASATVSTATRIRGPNTARLVGSAGADRYLRQTVSVSGAPDLAVNYSPSAWFVIDPDEPFSPALEERGLWASDGTTTTCEVITSTTQRGVPVRVECEPIPVPAGTTRSIELRLYAAGVIHWGATGLVAPESVSTGPFEPQDVTNIVLDLHSHAQRRYTNSEPTKTDLGIAFSGPLTGTRLIRTYPFADAASIVEAMGEFPGLGICDLGITWDAGGTARTLTLWSPRRGAARPDLAITTADLVGDFDYQVDARASASHVRVVGRTAGPAREFALASDTSVLGLSRERLVSAAAEVSLDGFDALAATELARTRRSVRALRVRLRSEDYLWRPDPLALGDVVPVDIAHGWVAESGDWRVAAIEIDPAAGTFEPTLNPE